MGASDFTQRASGNTAREAFEAARRHARHMYGHGGYTGTIAEKDTFTMIAVPAEFVDHPRYMGQFKDRNEAYAHHLTDENDPRIIDKWGPAGCIDCGDGKYLFFGLASS